MPCTVLLGAREFIPRSKWGRSPKSHLEHWIRIRGALLSRIPWGVIYTIFSASQAGSLSYLLGQSFKGQCQTKRLLVLLTVVRDQANGWGLGEAAITQKTAGQCTPKNTKGGSKEENPTAANGAMHGQETQTTGWGGIWWFIPTLISSMDPG